MKYGAPQAFKLRDVALHAYYLSFNHPVTNSKVIFLSFTDVTSYLDWLLRVFISFGELETFRCYFLDVIYHRAP